MQKEEKAITLIALIITIIVMLILVGVTVNIAINGELFSTAKRAVTKTEEAKESELRFMAMTNAATHNEEWVYEVEEERIPIPAGFAPTEIEGENSIEDGIVIIDAEGNEFVWIPCSLDEYNGATFKSVWDQDSYDEPNSWKDNWNYSIDDEKGGIKNVEIENVGQDSLQKLETRKTNRELTEAGVGFYVARYEAGIPENEDFSADSEGDIYYLNDKKNTTACKPVSKKGYPAWNFISQTNAKNASAKMYPGLSYLIDSHAWNYICDKKFSTDEIKDSTKIGNYYNNETTKYEELDVLYALHSYSTFWISFASKYNRGVIPPSTAPKGSGTNRLELSTGASEDFKKYNIYDMAGNMWEWTTEERTNYPTDSTSAKTFAVTRGGSFQWKGDAFSVVHASGNATTSDYSVIAGFRVVLYL